MEQVTVDLGERSYPIYIGSGVLKEFGRYVGETETVILTDENVGDLYGETVVKAIGSRGKTARMVTVPAGEGSKDILRLMEVYDDLILHGAQRKTPLAALGGGVVGDLGGFCAATYMRGIPYIQIPTTLLAQVDSSVGGKTAINHPHGKNLIGAFYQPSFVFIDIDTLFSLPANEFLSGLAEVIKYGIVLDGELFTILEEKRKEILAKNRGVIAEIVRRSVTIKADVVKRDEREMGLRAVLNFGHTIGHAVEKLMGYGTVPHGIAVAKGIAVAVRISERSGFLSQTQQSRIITLLEAYGYDLSLPKATEKQYIEAFSADKKGRGGEINIVLTAGVGSFILKYFSLSDILDFIEY